MSATVVFGRGRKVSRVRAGSGENVLHCVVAAELGLYKISRRRRRLLTS